MKEMQIFEFFLESTGRILKLRPEREKSPKFMLERVSITESQLSSISTMLFTGMFKFSSVRLHSYSMYTVGSKWINLRYHYFYLLQTLFQCI